MTENRKEKKEVHAGPLTQGFSCLSLFYSSSVYLVSQQTGLNLCMHLNLDRVKESVHPRYNSNRGQTHWIIESTEIEFFWTSTLKRQMKLFLWWGHLLTSNTYKNTCGLANIDTNTILARLYLSLSVICKYTHGGNIHQRRRPSSEETLRLKREHCVSLPLLLLSFFVWYSLLIFALCTVDNVC